MGVLLPEDLPLSSLANDAERLVVEALRDRLTDGHDDTVSDELLYVGLSRAVMSATVIGPTALVGRVSSVES